MSVSSKLISALDSLIYAYKSGIKTSLKDYSDLESVISPTTIVSKDGSMATVFEIFGSKSYIGDEEIILLEEQLYSTLKSSLQKEGHQLQFVFAKDKARVKDFIRSTQEPARVSAKNLQLELDDLFESRVEHLSKFCAYESCYLVVWSTPELIMETLKDQQDENLKRSQKAPIFIDAQNIIIEYERLESNHNALCETIKNAFALAGLNIDELNVRKAIKDIRTSISHENTAKNWEPSLPIKIDEDSEMRISIPMKDTHSYKQKEKDPSNIMWESISSQLFGEAVSVEDSNVIKMGEKYISSLYVDIPPQNVSPFASLLSSIDKDLPFQISFSLESGGLNKSKMRAMAASILAVTNSGNKMVRDSINYLKDLELEGESIVKLSINAITWADNLKELNVRKQTINKKLQSWGNAQIAFNNIDPIEGFLSTVPAVSRKSSSSPALAPLTDIIKMLPLSRQSHVWSEGSVLFRTPDGKVFPFQPGSSLQNTWNYLVFATPGSGKSVLMNAMNLASVIQAGMTELPYIGILDIGPSSAGLIQLLRDALPEKLKDLVIYKRIQNTPKYAINIFDTILGSRYPTPSEKTFLVNLLTLIMTPAGADKPYSSTDAMVSKIIDKAYERFADDVDSTPKLYRRGYDKNVDDILDKYGLDTMEEEYSWWEIVDYLFDKKELKLAGSAQRYAVPVLEDLIEVAMSTSSINDMYSKPSAETKENMIELFSRSITESISQYPMLALPTAFDISSSRIISLDLDEVAKGDDQTAMKKNAIMFMVGRYVVGKNFKISKDEVKDNFLFADPEKEELASKYLNHHLKIAKANRQVKKILCIDEFHRTEGVEAIRNQVKTDQREGRKWNLQVVLSSQLVKDFGKDMRELSTGVFIMSGGAGKAEELADMFDLNFTTKEVVKNKLNGPTREGAPFIFNCVTKTGAYSQYLFSTLSPVEIWSLTTTAEDSTLRDRLTEELGDSALARKILADAFKSGSAKSRIEKIKNESTDARILKDPYTYLINKLKKNYDIF